MWQEPGLSQGCLCLHPRQQEAQGWWPDTLHNSYAEDYRVPCVFVFPPGLLDKATSQGRSRHPCQATISQPGCQNRQRYCERMKGRGTMYLMSIACLGFLCSLSAQEWGRLCSQMPDTSHARWPILSTPWGSRLWVQSGPSSAWFWASYLTTANTPWLNTPLTQPHAHRHHLYCCTFPSLILWWFSWEGGGRRDSDLVIDQKLDVGRYPPYLTHLFIHFNNTINNFEKRQRNAITCSVIIIIATCDRKSWWPNKVMKCEEGKGKKEERQQLESVRVS